LFDVFEELGKFQISYDASRGRGGVQTVKVLSWSYGGEVTKSSYNFYSGWKKFLLLLGGWLKTSC